MTTINRPYWARFTVSGGAGVGAAMISQGLATAGFAGHDGTGFDNFAILTCAAFSGLPGDVPAWTLIASGNNLCPGRFDENHSGFNPIELVSSGSESSYEIYMNGVTGSWWIANGDMLEAVGTRIRRFPADMHDGIAARYMVLARSESWSGRMLVMEGGNGGSRRVANNICTFSPIGSIDNNGRFVSARIPGVMQPTIAPAFPYGTPQASYGLPMIYLGDYLDLMVATDGFDLEEEPMPGWRIFKSDTSGDGPYLVVPAHEWD